MKFFLTLKHWQLFLITWTLPLLLNFLSFSDPLLLLRYFPIMMLFFIAGVYGWIWSVAAVLHPRLPADVKINLSLVHILFFIPSAYLLIIMWYMFGMLDGTQTNSEPGGGYIALLVVAHLGSMVCIFLGLRYSAKIMKSVELGRMAKFGDYAGEFFLMWFQPVGVWILQPRLNKMVKEVSGKVQNH